MPDHEERPATTLAHGAIKSDDIERVRQNVDESEARVARSQKTSGAHKEREPCRKATREQEEQS